MSANVYARIAERYQVPASDDEAIERFFFDVAPTLSREEREAIVAELQQDELAASQEASELPVDVPVFSIDEAPPIPQTSTLARLVGELSAALETRVRERLGITFVSAAAFSRTHARFQHALVYLEIADSVREAVRRMTQANVDVVAVRDNDRLVGVLSEHDVLVRVVAQGLDPDDTTVASVMTKVD